MNPRRYARASLATLLVSLLSSSAAFAGPDWPQYRGAHRDGSVEEALEIEPWPDSGPAVLWRQPISVGYSSISIDGDRIYTAFAEDERGTPRRLRCRDRPGDLAYADRPYFEEEFGDGPRSTPTLDGDRIYILGSLGRLNAVSADDGGVLWTVEFMETFGAPRPRRGFSTSVLIDGDLVVARPGGGDGKGFAAFEKMTGETRWIGLDGGPAPSSPIAIEVGGERQYVFVGNQVRGVSTSGEELWSYEWGAGAIAMPVFVAPDMVFLSASYDVGSALIRIVPGESGFEVEELWRNKAMKNHFNSSVLHEGHVYGFNNAILKCVSIETGEPCWAKRGLGKGSLILAGDQLVVLSDGGKLALVEASPEGYKEVASFQALEGKSWTAPSYAAGRLYLRNQTEMIAIDLSGEEVAP